MKQQRMSLTEILAVYHSAVQAIIPFAERVLLTWREGESYDDWDAIVETLWMTLVVGTLSNAVSPDTPLCMPKYGFEYDVYDFKDMILVDREGHDLYVFHSFVFDDVPQTRIRVSRVNRDDHRMITSEIVRFDEVTFILARRVGDSWGERIRDITLNPD